MRAILAAIFATTVAMPAFAQDATGPAVPASAVPNEDTGGDFYVVGLGAAVLPDYEGSDDYSFSPVPAATGRVSGFNFLLAGNRASVDLIRDGVGPTWDIQAGPIAVVNLNRNSTKGIDDAQVRALGTVGTAIELGGYVGIGKTGVITSQFDRLSASLSYRKDVAGGHKSTVLAPTINYVTPLSLRAIAGVFVSAERVGEGYADRYFSVNQAQSLASGLPIYNARSGWKNWTLGALAGHSISGDLRSGWQLFGTVVYRKLLNDFADSPLVARNGSSNQWLGAVGVAYSF
ncbi:MipA/OmpV family protein [Sphingomonas hankookensis]|uniref:MipA/OmpV family protein n=1 Tax=Sphingomonas hankookensis TaxID=563996 RepID=UPI001F59211B|nr:MipA/OmpV family protein [Sphingomonas hankookensis]